MILLRDLDTSFDFRTDTPPGKDPDAFSPTLRSYHKLLWSKPLPSGKLFDLDATTNNVYLHHNSDLGEFFLASDSAIHTFSKWKSMAHIIEQINEDEIEAFRALGYTIGGMLIFPSNRIDGKSTINGARGFHPLIKDRIDLTIECIRRYYIQESSPLTEVFDRYTDFFALFESFEGYVTFFLLQDLVTENFEGINFFTPFDAFKTSPLPKSLKDYIAYKKLVMEFVRNRNLRIAKASS